MFSDLDFTYNPRPQKRKEKRVPSEEEHDFSEESAESARLSRKNARPSLKKVTKTREDEGEMSGQTSRRRADVSLGKRPALQDDSGSEDDDVSMETTQATRPSMKSLSPSEKSFALLMRNDFEGTRYPDHDTMDDLGIRRDVEQLFHNSNLSTFMNFRRESYKEETCQFLASLEVHFYTHPAKKPNEGLGFITFTVDTKKYSLKINEVDELFGFPRGTEPDADFEKSELPALWNTIGSKRSHVSAKPKSYEIRNPAVRYFHKSIASTFFARRHIGTVNDGEMKLIDLALKEPLRTTSSGKVIRGDRAEASLSVLLLDHLSGYRDWAAKQNKGKKGVLSVGGIVTPILLACKVPLTTSPIGPRLLDIPHLKQALSLARGLVNEKFIWQFYLPGRGDSQILLPCSKLTSIETRSNIIFLPSPEELYDPDNGVTERDDGPQDMDCSDDYQTEQFYFEESSTREGKSLKTAHKYLSLGQRWNKIQDKAIRKLKGTVKELAETVKRLSMHKNESPKRSSSPPESPLTRMNRRVRENALRRSGSSSRPAQQTEPARASSYEHTQRKRRATRSPPQPSRHSTSQFDLGRSPPIYVIPDVEMPDYTGTEDEPANFATRIEPSLSTPQATPSTSAAPAYTQESMNAAIDCYFS